MKKLFYFSLLLLGVTFASCKEQEQLTPLTPIIGIPQVKIELANQATPATITIPQDSMVMLKAIVTNSTKFTIAWTLDNKQVSTDSLFTFTANELGKHTIKVEVESLDGAKSKAELQIEVYGKYKYGTWILNEGNMTSENGSLIFISEQGAVTDSVYWRVNGSFLGNTTQDLFIANNKMYVISQNGTGDGMLVIANSETMKKEAAFSKEELTATVDDKQVSLSWPTHIAVVGNNAYIRDNKGVYRLDLTSGTLTLVTGTARAAKNRMAVVGDKVFVPAGKNIYVIKGGDAAVLDTIKMSGTVSGIIKSYDENLWVSCTTTPAQINKINASTLSIISTNELGSAPVGAGFGATPAISAINDTLYFSNASSKVYRHVFSSNETQYVTDIKEHIENAGMIYNNLAVNPRTGEVYFTTIKGYGMDYLINDISVFDFSKPTPELKADYKDHTHFPAGIFFTYDFE